MCVHCHNVDAIAWEVVGSGSRCDRCYRRDHRAPSPVGTAAAWQHYRQQSRRDGIDPRPRGGWRVNSPARPFSFPIGAAGAAGPERRQALASVRLLLSSLALCPAARLAPRLAAPRRLQRVCVGQVLDGAAPLRDRPFFRPGISPVGADRAGVTRCHRALPLVVVRCCCCHRCCQPAVDRPSIPAASDASYRSSEAWHDACPSIPAACTASAPGTFRPGCGPGAPPLPSIGLTAAALLAAGEVSRADSRVHSPGTFTCARRPAARSALDAAPEAYDNPAAVWWGALAASVVIWDQAVIMWGGSFLRWQWCSGSSP